MEAEKPGEQTVKGYLKWCKENDKSVCGLCLWFTGLFERLRNEAEKEAKQKNVADI